MLQPTTARLLFALLLCSQGNCQRDRSNQVSTCPLAKEDIDALVDDASRTWTVTDATLEKHDIQSIINCTKEWDMVALQTTKTIQPQHRIVLPWELVLYGSNTSSHDSTDAPKPSMTCPPGEGLFFIMSEAVLLSFTIKGCNLKKEDNVIGIIETDACSPDTNETKTLSLLSLDFMRNTNLGGSVGVLVPDPACIKVSMMHVVFQESQFSRSSELGYQNVLHDLRLERTEYLAARQNKLTEVKTGTSAMTVIGSDESLFYLPQKSKTYASQIFASENKRTVLRMESADLSIEDSVFARNFANVLFAKQSNIVVKNSKFSENGCGLHFAALSLFGESTGYFYRVKFEHNFIPEPEFQADYICGRAVYLAEQQYAYFVDCVFESNYAPDGGAALLVYGTPVRTANVSLYIANCTFARNLSPTKGGAVSITGWENAVVFVKDSRFVENNVVNGTQQGQYGAFYLSHSQISSLLISASTFDSNVGEVCGGVCFHEVGGGIQFNSTRFVRNKGFGSNSQGGAVSIRRQEYKIAQPLWQFDLGSLSMTRKGEQIWISGKKTSSSVQHNYVSMRAMGTGLGWLADIHELKIINCTFEENQAREYGGAISLINLPLQGWLIEVVHGHIEQSTFIGNKAKFGGAIYREVAPLEITSCIFEKNRAAENGGAVHVSSPGRSSVPFFKQSTFVKNQAAVGGALFFAGNGNATISENCRFSNNVASKYGGAIFMRAVNASDKLHLDQSTLIHNRAKLGGSAYFQIDEQNVEVNGQEDPNVYVNSTTFRNNHAERAGGAIFTERISAIDMKCDPAPKASWRAVRGLCLNNFKCSIMTGSSVGKGGYGKNIATLAEDFVLEVIYEDGLIRRIPRGESYSIRHWKSGDKMPIFKIVMLDFFFQSGALTKAVSSCQESSVLSSFDGYTKATMDSRDKLIPNPLITNVSAGTGNITAGALFNTPNRYSLELWTGDNKSKTIVVNITIRGCQINEQSNRNKTVCDDCGRDHYNFDPEKGRCMPCPDDCDCTEWGLAPKKKHWIPSPCFPNVMECLSDRACHRANREQLLTDFYVKHSKSTCDLDKDTIEEFNRLQCRQGHEGLLCGSCSENYGQFKLGCFECVPRGVVILWLLVSAVWLFVVSAVSVIGNLTDTEEQSTRETFSRREVFSSEAMDLSSVDDSASPAASVTTPLIQEERGPEQGLTIQTNSPSEEGASTRRDVADSRSDAIVSTTTVAKRDVAKRNLTESVKLLVNFSQVNSMALAINARWTRLVEHGLKASNIVGAVSLETTISLDCLFPESAAVPRSICRTIVSLLLPFVVLAIGAICWTISIPNNLPVLKRRLVLTTVVVFYISYIGWVEHLSSVINCVKIEHGILEGESISGHYWTEDTSVECFKGSHAALVGVLVVPMILIIVLAFPIGSAFYLHLKRKKNQLDALKVKQKFGFMYAAYTEQGVFWDCIILLRKAALALVVVFGASLGSNVQGVTSVCILILALWLQMLYRPFRDEYATLNSIETFSILVCLFTFISGLYFNDTSVKQTGRFVVSVVAIVLMSSFAAYFVYDFYRKVATFCRVALECKHVSVEEASDLKVIVVWMRHKLKRPPEGSRQEAA